MKLFNNLLTATIVASLLASCSSDIDTPISDNPSNLQGRTIILTVGVSDPDNVTRTWYDTNNGDLGVTWAQDDKLVVTTDGVSGVNLGVLDYDMDKNNDGLKATAYFKGVITLPEGANKIHLTYLGSGKTTEELKTFNGDYRIDVSSQTGSIKDFSAHDVQTSNAITIPEGATTFDVSTTLIRNISFGHFDLQLPVKLDANDVVTVSGADVAAIHTALNVNLNGNIPSAATNSQGAITVTMRYGTTEFNETDLYLAMVPQTTDLTFTVTKDDVTYTATLGSNTWLSTEYYRNDTDDAGIPVTNWTEIRPIDDTVGPVFTVNGKSFKFTKANLAFNISTRKWYLLDEQYLFLGKKGWYNSNGKLSSISGCTAASDIDLFCFGSTGLQFVAYNVLSQGKLTDFNEKINNPEFFTDKTSLPTNSDGSSYPTSNSNLNNLFYQFLGGHGIQDHPTDWGYAYGLQQNNGNHYYTLLNDEWKGVFDNHFVCGLTISDAVHPVSNKKGINGLIIFESNDKNTVSELLSKYNSSLPSGIVNMTSSSKHNDYKKGFISITVENFKNLENSGQIVFLPEAGRSQYIAIREDSNCGAYWTATAGQYTTSNEIWFDTNRSSEAIFYSDCARHMGNAVRLVKEVKQ